MEQNHISGKSNSYSLLLLFLPLLMESVTISAQRTCTHLTAVEGETSYLTSPNYPDNYDSDTTMCWTIEAVYPSHRVRLETIDFRLELDALCVTDFLEVRQGSASGKLIDGRHCSSRGPKITSSDRTLYLRFVTDQTHTAKGFKLKFTSVKPLDSGNTDPITNDSDSNSSSTDWTVSPNLYLLIIACVVGGCFLICGATVIVAFQHKQTVKLPSAASSQQELSTHIQIEHTSHNEAQRSHGTLEPSAPPVHYGNANPSSHIATLPPSYTVAMRDHQGPYMAYGNDAFGS